MFENDLPMVQHATGYGGCSECLSNATNLLLDEAQTARVSISDTLGLEHRDLNNLLFPRERGGYLSHSDVAWVLQMEAEFPAGLGLILG